MEDISTLRQRLRYHQQQRDHDQVIETLSELRRCEPDNPRWPQKQGTAYRRVDDSQAAISCFETAIQLYADQAEPLKAIALCKVILGISPIHRYAQRMLDSMSGTDYTPGHRPVRTIELPPDPFGSDLADGPSFSPQPMER